MPKRVKPQNTAESGLQKIYGRHAVCAALKNHKRRLEALLVTENYADDEILALAEKRGVPIRAATKGEMADSLGSAVHQGVVLEAHALTHPTFRDFVLKLQAAPHATILLADRISDPQNIGAIVRNMAAFGGACVVLPTHHAPSLTGGALAKAAAGALEIVPIFRQTNIAQTLQFLQKHGFWCYASDTSGDTTVAEADLPSHCAFVLGSEGEGVRPLVLKTCDGVLRIPMASSITGGAGDKEEVLGSLNVSAAAAIILHQRYLKLST